MNKFSVVEQIHPQPNLSNRYRVVESVQTSDGIRSRLTNKTSENLQELIDWIEAQP